LPPTIEVFLLDYEEDLYDKILIIHYLKKIRDMKKFPSPQDLQKEIEKDIQKTKDFFKLK